jgi:hypothetical protein
MKTSRNCGTTPDSWLQAAGQRNIQQALDEVDARSNSASCWAAAFCSVLLVEVDAERNALQSAQALVEVDAESQVPRAAGHRSALQAMDELPALQAEGKSLQALEEVDAEGQLCKLLGSRTFRKLWMK